MDLEVSKNMTLKTIFAHHSMCPFDYSVITPKLHFKINIINFNDLKHSNLYFSDIILINSFFSCVVIQQMSDTIILNLYNILYIII